MGNLSWRLLDPAVYAIIHVGCLIVLTGDDCALVERGVCHELVLFSDARNFDAHQYRPIADVGCCALSFLPRSSEARNRPLLPGGLLNMPSILSSRDPMALELAIAISLS
jgi:hypothetical protein